MIIDGSVVDDDESVQIVIEIDSFSKSIGIISKRTCYDMIMSEYMVCLSKKETKAFMLALEACSMINDNNGLIALQFYPNDIFNEESPNSYISIDPKNGDYYRIVIGNDGDGYTNEQQMLSGQGVDLCDKDIVQLIKYLEYTYKQMLDMNN